MTPEQIDKAIEDFFSFSPEDQQKTLRLLVETGDRLFRLVTELESGKWSESTDGVAYDIADNTNKRLEPVDMGRPEQCPHKNTESVYENYGEVVMRCLECGAGKHRVGNWTGPVYDLRMI